MELFKTILCPIDFSEISGLALRFASAFAQLHRARLIVCYCIPAYPEIAHISDRQGSQKDILHAEIKGQLEKFLAEYVHYKLETHSIVEEGSPAQVILQTAVNEKPDLIVMGTHGAGGIDISLLGSVTNKVLHKAKVPVLTVCRLKRTLLSGDPDEPLLIGKILCAVDPSRVSLKMIALAMSLARSYHSTITFFSVQQTPSGKSIEDDLKKLVQLEKEEHFRVQFAQTGGNPVHEILKAVRQGEIDLLIMGHHSLGSVGEDVVGSVSLRVIPKSDCPVLVVQD